MWAQNPTFGLWSGCFLRTIPRFGNGHRICKSRVEKIFVYEYVVLSVIIRVVNFKAGRLGSEKCWWSSPRRRLITGLCLKESYTQKKKKGKKKEGKEKKSGPIEAFGL